MKSGKGQLHIRGVGEKRQAEASQTPRGAASGKSMRLPHPWSGRKSQENRVTTYLPAGFGALGGCQWREVSSPALWSRQSFGGAGGAAGVSRCGASHCETIPLGSVVGQDGADSLAAYRQEDPMTTEVDDLNRNESLELKHQRVVVLNEDKTQIV